MDSSTSDTSFQVVKTIDLENGPEQLASTSTKMALSWTNVNMVYDKNGKQERHILKDVWGETRTGESIALLGPSGAGKSSLFHILTGRASGQKSVTIEADVRLGGHKATSSMIRKNIAFVAQEDSLHGSSTPKEAMQFSARMRLPRSTTDEQINSMVNRYINELGLSSCQDTVIGGGLKKGLSGGEKKRLSVGIELVVNPPIILLDEPTSGLDSFSAAKVVKVLNQVAASGTSVLFTLHQPSSEVWSSIDRYILLNRGRIMHQGFTCDLMQEFKQFGYPMPPTFNPAEWALSVAQKESDSLLQNCGFYLTDVRKQLPVITSQTGSMGVLAESSHATLGKQLILLLNREKNSLIRDREPMITNVCCTLALSLVYGIFFWQVGTIDRSDPTNVQAQQGVLQNIQISTMLGQQAYAMMTLPQERPLFLREYSTNHYSCFPYFVSKLCTEAFQTFTAILIQSIITYYMIGFQLPFFVFFTVNFLLAMTVTAIAVLLGGLLTNLRSISDLYALTVVPQFFFSGVFAPIDLIPSVVRWAQYLCSLKYAAGLTMMYEFGSCAPGVAAENCKNILERNNVDQGDEWWYWLALAGLFVVFRVLGLVALKLRATVHS